MSTKITDDLFEFGGQGYFRGNAHLVQVGTYGRKRDPLGPRGYLDPVNKIMSEYLEGPVQTGTTATVDWNQTDKGTVEVNGLLKYFGLNGEVGTNVTYEKVRSADLVLQNLFILEGPLRGILNTRAGGARNYLAREGSDGRVLGEAWTLMSGKLAEHFRTYYKTSHEVKGAGAELAVTVTGGKYGAQTVTYSVGTVFAYKLYKVADWNSGKTRIEKMVADNKS
jgi:hypothetical protein